MAKDRLITSRRHSDSFIAECKATAQALAIEIANLQKRMDLLDKEIRDLRDRRRHYVEILQMDGIPVKPEISEPGKASNADLAYQVLLEAKSSLHVRKIWNLLSEMGVKSSSRDPVNMLAATLSNDARFKKTAPRTFGISLHEGTEVSLFRANEK